MRILQCDGRCASRLTKMRGSQSSRAELDVPIANYYHQILRRWISCPMLDQLPSQVFDALTRHPSWDSAAIRVELNAALNRIAQAPIQEEPFPHIVVEELFSARFYRELLRELPPPAMYRPLF